MQIAIDPHIEVDLGIRDGKPCIVGTRIAISDVVLMHLRLGQSLEQIAGHYDVSLAALHAAMAYYYDHQSEVDRVILEENAALQAIRERNPSLVKGKLKAIEEGG